MNISLIKYSPEIQNLRIKDQEAFCLFAGFIRENCPSISYVIIRTIFIYWNYFQIQNLDQFKKQRSQKGSFETEFHLLNIHYKFTIFMENLFSIIIYPWKGIYRYMDYKMNQTNKIITRFTDTWTTASHFIELGIHIYRHPRFKPSNGLKIGNQHGLVIELKSGSSISVGKIQIKNIPYDSKFNLQISLWHEGNAQNLSSRHRIND